MTQIERMTPSHQHGHEPHAIHDPEAGSAVNLRILELENENLRLQRLVAELLLKNQQLRRED